MTDDLESPVDLELLAMTDPLAALSRVQSPCVVAAKGERPEWRETYLSILRPWWESAPVEEMAHWLSRWAGYESSGEGDHRLHTVIRLACLAAKCMDLHGDPVAIAEVARIEAWAFSDVPADGFDPIIRDDDRDGGLRLGAAYLRAAEHLSEAIWHRQWRGDVADFFHHAFHASNGEDFAPLIRAALPLETLVP